MKQMLGSSFLGVVIGEYLIEEGGYELDEPEDPEPPYQLIWATCWDVELIASMRMVCVEALDGDLIKQRVMG